LSGTFNLKFQSINRPIDHTFMFVFILKINVISFILLDISVLNELFLGHLCYLLIDVPL
ncbi:hypothetical protein C1645_692404, partial [Glomus cerebriforme]